MSVARRHPDVTLAMAARRYAAAAAAIAVAGVALPFAGSAIADIMGWNRTFVGTLLIAGATSLPELVVTIAAVRYGALNMAVAGLLGSNLFNMLILAIEDGLYLPGPLLAHVSPAHAVSAISAMIMTGKPQEIADQIITELERGVTFLSGTGAYTGEERPVLYVVVSRAEIAQVRAIVHEADPTAFMVIGVAHEALGEGFRSLKPS